MHVDRGPSRDSMMRTGRRHRAAIEERRSTPRSVALEFRAWIGWRAGGDLVATAVRLLDVSRGGVAIEAEEPPPPGLAIWFCLASGHDRHSLSGRVVATGRGSRGRHIVRLAFLDPCPDGLLRDAIRGTWDRSTPLVPSC